MTISSIVCVHSLMNSRQMAYFKNKLKPHVQTKTRSNTCMTQLYYGNRKCKQELKLYNENRD